MMRNKLILFLASCICLVPSFSYAVGNFEFTPSISIGELYDDNIDLTETNQRADWITTLSPGINLNLVSEKNNFSLNYSPSIVRYKNEDHNNTIRHSGALIFNENFTNHFSVSLGDTLTRSEDPIEQTQGIYGLRRTRSIYIRNNSTAGIRYLFGPENILNLNLNYSLLNNKDVALEDNNDLNPSVDMTYWFNVNNGVELNYQYTQIKYSRDDNGITSDNLSGNTSSIKYQYRFNSHTTAFLSYTLNTREFENQINNYDIHNGYIGLTQSFSTQSNFSLSGGYFKLKNKVGSDDNGYSFALTWTKSFEKGSLSLGGSGGWREGFLEAERQGLLKYWSSTTSFEYQIYQRLINHVSLSYMNEKDEQDNKYSLYSVSYGLRTSFLQWYSLAIDYFRSTRKDDIKINSYNDNRVMLTLSASRLFR
jgi:hypothetical protein